PLLEEQRFDGDSAFLGGGEEVGARGHEGVDTELVEPRIALPLGEQAHLAELADVAKVEAGRAVGELELEGGVRVGTKLGLLGGSERRAALGREQADAARAGREELAGHAEVEEQARAVV